MAHAHTSIVWLQDPRSTSGGGAICGTCTHKYMYCVVIEKMVSSFSKLMKKHSDLNLEFYATLPPTCMLVRFYYRVLACVHVYYAVSSSIIHSYVVNYDFPVHIEDYVHRVGRTGRAG